MASSAWNIVDPALGTLVAEQQDFIDGLEGHFAPAPVQPPPSLPAQDVDCDGCSVRVIRPEGPARAVFLHIHGGGFTHGSAAMMDAPNSVRARELQAAVVSVDYRLAPAHCHPVQLDECTAAALWLMRNAQREFGTDVLLIGGESIGASLAVLTLLRLRDEHGDAVPFRAASLVVGTYDFSMTPSQRLATEAHFLSPEHLAETRAAAFPGRSLEELRDASFSALYADLQGMPAALFTAGAADSVLDDSLFMASRWRASGNDTRLEVYPGAPHLFMTYPTRMAAEARRRIVEFLRDKIAADD